jgi:hypothetical protein
MNGEAVIDEVDVTNTGIGTYLVMVNMFPIFGQKVTMS